MLLPPYHLGCLLVNQLKLEMTAGDRFGGLEPRRCKWCQTVGTKAIEGTGPDGANPPSRSPMPPGGEEEHRGTQGGTLAFRSWMRWGSGGAAACEEGGRTRDARPWEHEVGVSYPYRGGLQRCTKKNPKIGIKITTHIVK